MALFDSIGDLVKTNIDDAIDRADDPEITIKQIILEMEEHLSKATKSIDSAAGSQSPIKKQLNDTRAQAQKWREQEALALQAGDKDLAKQATANKIRQEKLAEQYSLLVSSMEENVSELHLQTAALKEKLVEARSKQSILIARKNK